jgi:hypothetical protein
VEKFEYTAIKWTDSPTADKRVLSRKTLLGNITFDVNINQTEFGEI